MTILSPEHVEALRYALGIAAEDQEGYLNSGHAMRDYSPDDLRDKGESMNQIAGACRALELHGLASRFTACAQLCIDLATK